jgi:hypothetical protein
MTIADIIDNGQTEAAMAVFLALSLARKKKIVVFSF